MNKVKNAVMIFKTWPYPSEKCDKLYVMPKRGDSSDGEYTSDSSGADLVCTKDQFHLVQRELLKEYKSQGRYLAFFAWLDKKYEKENSFYINYESEDITRRYYVLKCLFDMGIEWQPTRELKYEMISDTDWGIRVIAKNGKRYMYRVTDPREIRDGIKIYDHGMIQELSESYHSVSEVKYEAEEYFPEVGDTCESYPYWNKCYAITNYEDGMLMHDKTTDKFFVAVEGKHRFRKDKKSQKIDELSALIQVGLDEGESYNELAKRIIEAL